MKLTKIVCEKKQIPLQTPFVTALRRVENVEFVRVSLYTQEFVGIGEAPATKAITGEDIESIMNSVKMMQSILLGLKIEDALTQVQCTDIGSSAKAALDMALITLLAQQRGQSLAEFFSLEESTPIFTDITISFNDTETMLKDAQKALEKKHHILKVKVAGDIQHAIKSIRQISSGANGAEILVDANQAWSLDDTLYFIDKTKDIELSLIEQPVPAKDTDSLKSITNYSNVAILADEAVFTLEDAQKIIESKSADMINIKLMKCGGVTPAIEMLKYAREKGVMCMLGSMLEGPYSINIALYLAMAFRDVVKFVDLDSPLLYKELPEELDFIYEGCKISLKK